MQANYMIRVCNNICVELHVTKNSRFHGIFLSTCNVRKMSSICDSQWRTVDRVEQGFKQVDWKVDFTHYATNLHVLSLISPSS